MLVNVPAVTQALSAVPLAPLYLCHPWQGWRGCYCGMGALLRAIGVSDEVLRELDRLDGTWAQAQTIATEFGRPLADRFGTLFRRPVVLYRLMLAHDETNRESGATAAVAAMLAVLADPEQAVRGEIAGVTDA